MGHTDVLNRTYDSADCGGRTTQADNLRHWRCCWYCMYRACFFTGRPWRSTMVTACVWLLYTVHVGVCKFSGALDSAGPVHINLALALCCFRIRSQGRQEI